MVNLTKGIIRLKTGETLSNRTHQGIVHVEGDNITIRNCNIDANKQYFYCIHGAKYKENGQPTTNLLIDNCRLRNSLSGGVNLHNATIQNTLVEEHDSDGIKIAPGGNVTCDTVTVQQIGAGGPTHGDAVALAGSNVIVRNSSIDGPRPHPIYNVNSIVFAKTTVALIDNILVHDCFLQGGIHTVWGDTGAQGPSTNWVVHDCTFGFELQGQPFFFTPGSTYNCYSNKWVDGTPIPDIMSS